MDLLFCFSVFEGKRHCQVEGGGFLSSAGPTCDLVQLAAVSGGHSLNLYLLPRRPLQPGAAKLTGFRVRRGRLCLHHRPVPTNSLREVLVSFIAFLRMLHRPLIVGHNIRRFDGPLLARVLDELDLRTQFESSVSGCVDTLSLAQEMLRGRNLQNFRQETLVRELLGVNYRAHDALQDVRALQALFGVLQPTAEMISRHKFTLGAMETRPTASCKVGVTQHRPLADAPRTDREGPRRDPTENLNHHFQRKT